MKLNKKCFKWIAFQGNWTQNITVVNGFPNPYTRLTTDTQISHHTEAKLNTEQILIISQQTNK